MAFPCACKSRSSAERWGRGRRERINGEKRKEKKGLNISQRSNTNLIGVPIYLPYFGNIKLVKTST